MRHKTLKFLFVMSALPIMIAPCVQPINQLSEGFYRILTIRGLLVTDYIAVGGIGAALLNVGLVSLLATCLIAFSQAEINGTAIASVFLMASFSFFGKNVINVLPILLGTFIFARVTHEPYKDIVHISLLSTSFAPVFNEVIAMMSGPFFFRILVASCVSMSVGFLIKPLARHLYNTHKGFNLYNTGFAVGILGTLYVSLFHSFGYKLDPQNIVHTSSNLEFTLALISGFIALFLTGIFINPNAIQSLPNLLKEPGLKNNDFLKRYGLGVVLMNMALNGLIALGYVVLIAKGDLSGPVIGGILTVVGFSGLGKTPLNTAPLYLGVVLGSFTKVWSINETRILLVALFGTSLAPISGTFGFFWGIVAGYLNSSVALTVRNLHSGINLYNTGLSSGVVAAVMVPILHYFNQEKKEKPDGISLEDTSL